MMLSSATRLLIAGAVSLVVVTLFGACERPRGRSADAADAATGPNVETTVTRELNEQEAARRRAEHLQRRPGVLIPSEYNQDARAAAGRMEIFWHAQHACGTEIWPRVEQRPGLVTLSVTTSMSTIDASACSLLTMFKTTVRKLPSGHYRVLGPDFDRMLVVPPR